MYSASPYVMGYEIGYEYTVSGQTKQTLRFFNSTIYDQWLFISETFKIPQLATNIRAVIKARYSIDPANPLPAYVFFMNGLSIGQWSEEFNTYSLGVNPSQYSAISTPSFSGTGVKAYAYGKEDKYGYYIADLSLIHI